SLSFFYLQNPLPDLINIVLLDLAVLYFWYTIRGDILFAQVLHCIFSGANTNVTIFLFYCSSKTSINANGTLQKELFLMLVF
ncbi:MAG: hypothetical protein VB098_12970, partial [Petrimonas sp.]|nr:hypothetical protein [Petrimonas sp.]